MHLSTITASLLGLAAFAGAAPSLQPWEISRLSTFSPSGRPAESPWSIINVTISDPNDVALPVTFCATKWTFEKPPYGIVNNCSEVAGGQWRFVMLESEGEHSSPTTDFRLRFELQRGEETYVGTEKFVVGENLWGLCSASGVCSFGLKEEQTPFPVKQVLVQ
ncbi:hypothetical protein C8A00DRAFT_46867 [Chaetomidium leptoderma]|uniref:AA1-like domain-containing protein n=1 Tax=Chaetomidium leptoderma TaxID=669021 RepID=A0AAN6VG34_9PEZI|nr:hypothetical protein C8A00DRAFT_46867 [Chaetomidium leptoderma]